MYQISHSFNVATDCSYFDARVLIEFYVCAQAYIVSVANAGKKKNEYNYTKDYIFT